MCYRLCNKIRDCQLTIMVNNVIVVNRVVVSTQSFTLTRDRSLDREEPCYRGENKHLNLVTCDLCGCISSGRRIQQICNVVSSRIETSLVCC